MFVPSINPGHALNALSAEKEAIERKIEKRSAIIAFIDEEMRNKVSLVTEIATAKITLLEGLSKAAPASRDYAGIPQKFREEMISLHVNSMTDFKNVLGARDHYMDKGKLIKLTADKKKELEEKYSAIVRAVVDAQSFTVSDDNDLAAKLSHCKEELRSAVDHYADLLDSKTPLSTEVLLLQKEADRVTKEKYDAEILRINDIFTACQFGYAAFIQNLPNPLLFGTKRKEVLDTPNAEGFRPIHFAAYHGTVTVINLLADFDADLNARDKNGYTALHWAAKAGELPAVKALIARGASVFTRGEYGRTVLHMSAFNSRPLVTEWLVQQKNAPLNVACTDEDNKKTPFFEPVIHGDVRVAKIFLKSPDLEVNARDIDGHTALYHAVCNGLVQLIPFILGHPNWAYPEKKDDPNHPLELLKLPLRYNKDETKRILKDFLTANPQK